MEACVRSGLICGSFGKRKLRRLQGGEGKEEFIDSLIPKTHGE